MEEARAVTGLRDDAATDDHGRRVVVFRAAATVKVLACVLVVVAIALEMRATIRPVVAVASVTGWADGAAARLCGGDGLALATDRATGH